MWTLAVVVVCVSALSTQAQLHQAATCPKPVDPVNGRVRLLYGGLRADFQCNPGFMLVGTNYALCAQDRWTWQPPLCVAAGCSVLDPMAHGFMAVSYSGAVVRFWCEDGFFLKGSDFLICDGRHWNDSQPDCIETSGRVAWGHVSKTGDFSFKYKPHRKQNGWKKGHQEWLLEADYTCITQTSAVSPPRVTNASPSTKWVVEEGKARLYTVYRCKWGYVTVGDQTNLYCKNSQWVGHKPKCVFKGMPKKTYSPSKPEDWSSYGANAHEQRLRRADYSCFKSVEGVTAPDVTSSTKIPRHTVIDGMPHLYVEYQCYDGYSLDGPSAYLYCKNDKWHGDKPTCIWKGNALADDHNVLTVCQQNNGGCGDTCSMVNGKAVCLCTGGTEINNDGQTCEDIDECKLDNRCDQICFNTHGSYECQCREGFRLMQDGESCETAQEVLKPIKQNGNDKVPPFVVFHNK